MAFLQLVENGVDVEAGQLLTLRKRLEGAEESCRHSLGRHEGPHLVAVPTEVHVGLFHRTLEGIGSKVDDLGPTALLAAVDPVGHKGKVDLPAIVSDGVEASLVIEIEYLVSLARALTG